MTAALDDVFIRTGEASDWTEHGTEVARALADAVDHSEGWLVEPIGPIDDDATTLVIAQTIVDSVAGGLIAAHGGAMRVSSVESDRITLGIGGACAGCGDIASTIDGRVRPALGRTFPMRSVVVDESPGSCGDTPSAPRSVEFTTPRSRRWRRSGCH